METLIGGICWVIAMTTGLTALLATAETQNLMWMLLLIPAAVFCVIACFFLEAAE